MRYSFPGHQVLSGTLICGSKISKKRPPYFVSMSIQKKNKKKNYCWSYHQDTFKCYSHWNTFTSAIFFFCRFDWSLFFSSQLHNNTHIKSPPPSFSLSQSKNHSLWTPASCWQCRASSQAPAHHAVARCIFVIYLNPRHQLQHAEGPEWRIGVLIFSWLFVHGRMPLSWHWGLRIKQR